MQKRVVVIKSIVLAVLFLIMILNVSGFSVLNFFEETSHGIIDITGRATTGSSSINLTLIGRNGDIYLTENVTTQSITDNSYTNVTISFYINDPDGAGTVVPAQASVNITKPDRVFSANRGVIWNYSSTTSGGCFSTNNINSTVANVSCNVHVWYFDPAGEWNITIMYYAANGSGESQNKTTNFTISSTSAIQITPSNLTFNSGNPGSDNVTSNNDPIIINNTGNVAATSGNVRITGRNLIGETTKTQYIPAVNFTSEAVNFTTADSNAGCKNGNNATALTNASAAGITNSVLAVGNHSINNGTAGLEHLFICLIDVPLGINAQAYSTLELGTWTIDVV